MKAIIAAIAEQPHDFQDNEVRLVKSAAEQLGVVLSNLQLTTEMQTTLERVALLNRRLSGEAWSNYLSGRDQWLVESGHAEQAAINTGLQVPIVVRGQTIGTFHVADASTDRQWQADEVTMLQTIAGEVALTIENARLIEQTQRTAQRESTINEINARVRQSVDLDAILRTAVNELGQSLKAARVVARVGTLTTDDARRCGRRRDEVGRMTNATAQILTGSGTSLHRPFFRMKTRPARRDPAACHYHAVVAHLPAGHRDHADPGREQTRQYGTQCPS